MAKLEKEFKQTAGISGKIKLTIAEMISGIVQSTEESGPTAEGQVRISRDGCQKIEASE
jgi:hypothetical protein